MVVLLGAAACAPVPPTPFAGLGTAAWSAPPLLSAVVPAKPGSTIAGPAQPEQGGAGPHYFGTPQTAQQASTPSGGDPFALVKVDYVSPSAIETFNDAEGGCMRKWAWSKLDRAPKTENAAALTGTKTHGQHERWLQFGTPYDLTTHEGEIAQATLHLLPPPGVANVEGEMTFQLNGITFGGKLDGEWAEHAGTPRLASHPPEGLEPIEHLDRGVVLDHKTGNKTFFKLAKEQLLKHPQAPIYATRSFLKYRLPIVELRWNYATTTKKPQPFPSWHVVRPEEIEAVWQEQVERPARRLLAVVDEANQTRRSGKPFGALQLPPNFNACAAFGGCAFRSRCALNGPQEIQAHMTQVNVQQQQADFLKTLGVGQASLAPAPAPGLPSAQFAPAPAVAPPAPVQWVRGMPNPSDPNWVYDGQGSWMPAAQFQAEQQQSAPLPPPVQSSPFPAVAQASAGPAPLTVAGPVPGQLPPQMAQGYGAQINPPESALPAADVAAAQAAAEPAPTEPAPKKSKAKKYDADAVFFAVLTGVCAGLGGSSATPEQIAGRAKAIAQAVTA